MRALISVSNKEGIVEFAKGLVAHGVEIISTGGTLKTLEANGVPVTGVSDVTGFPECLDGRVKTLHPKIHGGLLARRDNPDHMEKIKELEIDLIDFLIVNLYPFKETVQNPDATLDMAIENIDIGGPTMLRSAAKNYRDVTVACDPHDYGMILSSLKELGGVKEDVKYQLALKVFEHTAAYDAWISDYLRRRIGKELPDNPTFTYEKIQDLRYGENPHQKAWYYKKTYEENAALTRAVQLHGKELSFNNINDANAALEIIKEFNEPTVVAVKHANPCGVATGKTLLDAYKGAYQCDPVSIFGGIIAVNRPLDVATAGEISKIFVEIIIAPDYEEEALKILYLKKNIRLLKLDNLCLSDGLHSNDCLDSNANLNSGFVDSYDMKNVSGGLLIQEGDNQTYNEEDLRVVTKKPPTKEELESLKFAMKVVKHVKSNGIVVAKDSRSIGLGPGQVNRIWAVDHALNQALESTQGAVLASDAFFPFEDCIERAALGGITAIIQPGGSINDEVSIKKADELGIAMVFTGIRHFKH